MEHTPSDTRALSELCKAALTARGDNPRRKPADADIAALRFGAAGTYDALGPNSTDWRLTAIRAALDNKEPT